MERPARRFPKQLPVNLSDAQRGWLDSEAQRRGLSSAAIVREMVQAAMNAAAATKQEGAA